jgi:hypothetical protein
MLPAMFETGRTHLLRLLRIPATPEAPWGAPESIQVFRPARNFYKLRLLQWSAGQVLTLVGIIFWIVMLGRWERDFDAARQQATSAIATRATVITSSAITEMQTPAPAENVASSGKNRRQRNNGQPFAARSPNWFFPLLRVVELIGLIGYLVQIPITYALLRLDYDLRWYIVTDRSLRIRQGLWRVQESTMSFANLQQVSVTQGPLQRWLQLADVHVQSAGGGGREESRRGRGENLHTGIFHGVANASEIRDLILQRLRRFRASGLGDPEEAKNALAPDESRAVSPDPALEAAKALLTETQALRRALE